VKTYTFYRHLLIPVGCGADNQNKQVLRNVKVKQRMYSRWKTVALDSIKIAMNALAAAVGFVNTTSAFAYEFANLYIF